MKINIDYDLTKVQKIVNKNSSYYSGIDVGQAASRQAADTEWRSAIALLCLIESISEDVYCAGWMMGIEFQLWKIIARPKENNFCGQTIISLGTIELLKALKDKAKGWWTWKEEEEEGLMFVSLELFSTQILGQN